MAGKRQRPIRRTVSASTMASNIFESSPIIKFPKEKQKLPVLSPYCPHGMLASTNPPKAPANSIANANAKSEAPSQPLPLLPKLNNKLPCTLPSYSWNRSERKPVGLGVVAAFSDESRAATRVKDGKDEAPPPVVNKNSIVQPVAFNSPHHNVDMQRRSAVFLHESLCKDDDEDRASMALPTVDFLEACYFCKRRLRHGFDIYMYRGDQAFCSEECRYEQILLDESKEKRSLQALKMKTSAPPFRSTDQKTRCMASGTTAAG